MAQPTPYDRLYNFTDWQTVNPTKPLPASELDAELNALELTTDQIRQNLALIQRDDGRLANQAVTPESLSAGALALINQGEYLPRGTWSAATAYAVGDVVEYNLATYLCLVAHTAIPAFADDLAAGRWLLIANGALAGGAAAVDLFEGDGSETEFTLSVNYQSSAGANVFVNGVVQIPDQDFTIAGNALTFLVAPPAPAVPGNKNVMVRGTAIEVQLAVSGATQAALDAQGFSDSASASALAASGSASSAAASFDSFDDRYLGAKASAPSLDNDGNALLVGAMYFNTTLNGMFVWTGSIWTPPAPAPGLVFAFDQTFSGTGSQTQFTLSQPPSIPGLVQVFISGVRQVNGADYTVAGAVLTFTIAPPAGTNNVYAVWTTPLAEVSTVTTSMLANGSVTSAKLAPVLDYGTLV